MEGIQKKREKAITEKERKGYITEKLSTVEMSTSYPRYRHLNWYIYDALTST